MNLELKHIAPYLPYYVEMYYNGTKALLVGLNKDPDSYYLIFNLLYEDGLVRSQIDCYKLLLRPLSDLTKEIEHNGERFVPHLRLGHRPNLIDYKIKYFEETKCETLPFSLVCKLLEWHFDVFGLIQNGLAIDINTLEVKK